MIFADLKLNEDEPIYKQLENYIENAINNGILLSDSKLPSSREASKLLGVSRNTIMTAYDNLESKGVIYSIKGRGSFVNSIATIALESEDTISKATSSIKWASMRNTYSIAAEDMDIIKTELPYQKGMISFKSIAPEGTLFDVEDFKRAFLDILAIEEEKILNYGYAQGYIHLINFLKEYMQQKGVDTTNKEILITNGFTEGLEIIVSSYLKPGDTIVCEEPLHHTSIKIFRAHEVNIVGVPMDSQGIVPDKLEAAIVKNNPKFVYLTPAYQNPTGIVMSGERRKRVCEILEKYSVPCIEDGFNEELLYSSAPIKPLSGMTNFDGMVYVGSLSKILFPGIRLGWILADKYCVSTLESVKRLKNIHTSFLDQAVFMQYMKSGAFERYLKKIRKFYKDKFLFTENKIKEYLPVSRIWGEGGLHIYVKLTNNINTRALLENCYKRGVLFMPGDIFHLSNEPTSEMRIGFARLSEEEIEIGLTIIGEEAKRLLH